MCDRAFTTEGLLLPVREPFAAQTLLGFLAMRVIARVETAADGVYRRTLALRHGHGLVELEPARGHVRCLLQLADGRDRDDAVRRCRALLDLDADPAVVDACLSADPLLAPLVAATPGLRVPGAADVAELATRAILGQQVSVAGARTLAGRLVDGYGEDLELGPDARPPPGAPARVFPGPASLAALDPDALAMPRARGRSLVALNAALTDGTLTLCRGDEPASTRAALQRLPGVGPWTAAYIAMRVLGDRDAFLPTDLALRRGLRRLGAADGSREVAEHAEAWRPYRSYAVMHLWNAS